MKKIFYSLPGRIFYSLFCALLLTATASAENQVIQQAQKAGIKQCLPALEAISGFLVGNDPHGAHDAWPKKETDKQIYSSTIERVTPEGVRLTSVSVAPVQAGGCSLVYDQVQWFDTSCLVVSKAFFPDLAYKGVLASKVAILEGAATVFLFPAGPGCLVLKKEVIVNANSLHRDKNAIKGGSK